MDDRQFTFLVEEYKSLRSQIDTVVKETWVLETGAIAGTAVVYAWLAKSPNVNIAGVAWWIPILFPFFGLLRQLAMLRRVMHMAEYIRSLEDAICTEEPHGWETFLVEKRKKISGLAISLSAVAFWISLFITTLIVGMLA